MTKMIKDQIVKMNEWLNWHNVKSESDSLFGFYQIWLIENGLYGGYNFYKRDENGNLVLSGDYTDYDCLQFIIK